MAAFVGRQRELLALGEAAARARRGEPVVVFIEGEAGVGKSTLLNHFVSEQAGAVTVRASGDDSERSLGYGLASQLVASARSVGVSPGSAFVDVREDNDALSVGAALLAVKWCTPWGAPRPSGTGCAVSPTTLHAHALTMLDRVGLRPGAATVDLGCGPARRWGPGGWM